MSTRKVRKKGDGGVTLAALPHMKHQAECEDLPGKGLAESRPFCESMTRQEPTVTRS